MATEAPNVPNKPTGGTSKVATIPASRRRSGMFTNLAAYLRGGAPGAARVGQKIGTGIEKRAAQAEEAIEPIKTEFGEEIERRGVASSVYGMAAGAAERIGRSVSADYPKSAGPKKPSPTALYKAPEKPETPKVTEEEIAAAARVGEGFKPETSAMGISERIVRRYEEARGLGAEAEKRAQRTATTEGREALLREQFARPQYTTGETRLDELLVAATPESRQRFASLRQQLSGETAPTAKVAAARDATTQQLAETQAASADYQNQLQEVLSGARSQIDAAVAKRLSTAQGLFREAYDELNRQIQGALGVMPIEGGAPAGAPYGIDTSKYIVDAQGNVIDRDTQLKRGDVLTERDVAAAQALAQLRGEGAQPLWSAEDISGQPLATQLGVNVAGLTQAALDKAAAFNREVEQMGADVGRGLDIRWLQGERHTPALHTFFNPKRKEETQKQVNNAENFLRDIVAVETKRMGGQTDRGQAILQKLDSAARDAEYTDRVMKLALYGGPNQLNLTDQALKRMNLTPGEIYFANYLKQERPGRTPIIASSEIRDSDSFHQTAVAPFIAQLNDAFNRLAAGDASQQLKDHINTLHQAIAAGRSVENTLKHREWLAKAVKNPQMIFKGRYTPQSVSRRVSQAMKGLPQQNIYQPSPVGMTA